MNKTLPVKWLSVKSPVLILALLVVSSTLLPSYIFKDKSPAKKADELAPTLILGAKELATNLQAPIDMAFAANGDVLVAEQMGKIRLIKNGKLADAPLLDIYSKLSKINESFDVRGILGFTIHPKFTSNKKVYIFYCAPTNTTIPKSDHKDVVEEYTLSSNDTEIDPNSGRIIFSVDEPQSNNNGGGIKFGPDAYLYVSMGDGGGGGDKHGPIGNGQNMNTWLGKMLRINVNSDSTYTIPKDNPFVSKPDTKPEIWAYGLRNAWRFSFDKATKQLFTSDVGEGTWEEVDIIEKGANYGWRVTEGNHCFNPKLNCDFNGITLPIAEYKHNEGVCVIGGYVYNGKQLPAIKGKYFFADWTGPVYYIQKTGNAWQRGKVSLQNYPPNLKIVSWGEDTAGEIYLITSSDTAPSNTRCTIYKIVKG